MVRSAPGRPARDQGLDLLVALRVVAGYEITDTGVHFGRYPVQDLVLAASVAQALRLLQSVVEIIDRADVDREKAQR